MKKRESIWTSVIDAFLKQTSTPSMSAMILKESTNDIENHPSDDSISPTMSAKVRCTTCHHKLNGKATADNCQRKECPQKPDISYQVLTFKDWEDPKFEVIKDFECKPDDFDWPSSGQGCIWDPVTKEWKEKDYSNEYYGC